MKATCAVKDLRLRSETVQSALKTSEEEVNCLIREINTLKEQFLVDFKITDELKIDPDVVSSSQY